jgi:hypothetical protein
VGQELSLVGCETHGDADRSPETNETVPCHPSLAQLSDARHMLLA